MSLRVGIAVESSLWGGLETHAVDLAGVIAARGHRPIVIASDHHTLELFRNAEVELQAASEDGKTPAIRRKVSMHGGAVLIDLRGGE